MRIPFPLFWFCWAILSGSVRGDVTLAPLFSDHAVLQRDKPIPVWGQAAPGEKITVTFLDQNVRATSASDGRWIAYLSPIAAQSEGTDLVVSGKTTVVLRDIVVGEVWLCAGSSAAELPPVDRPASINAAAAGNVPLVRQIRIVARPADHPSNDAQTSGWELAAPVQAGEFAATGFFFARDLAQKLGVPIGLIHGSAADSPIESWLSPIAFASDPMFAAAFEGRSAAAGPGPDRSPAPATLFNGVINPILPFALRGMLWSEGENLPGPEEYRAMFAAMLIAWRAHFGQGDFPVYWVQLPRRSAPSDKSGTGLAPFREAQAAGLSLPNSGQAVAIDLDASRETANPAIPAILGRRLASLAKNRLYGITADDSGPMFLVATREGSAMRVRLAHATSGLVAHDKPVQSLELAGADKVFRPATARIDRESLLVSSPEVRMPVAVRYAWRNAPTANLYNGSGQPAAPFRSDDW